MTQHDFPNPLGVSNRLVGQAERSTVQDYAAKKATGSRN